MGFAGRVPRIGRLPRTSERDHRQPPRESSGRRPGQRDRKVAGDEQIAIAEVLTEMDAELAALEQRREKTRALKQAMMQELLTGKTRLV